ncbi:MAG: 3-deoxy-7-phosphoheptulonate synthase [Lachnospiraceae bacterium]|jgi:3-deoxy-7-phosphoheptulonate synthase
MSFSLTKKLPTPAEIKELYPVSPELSKLKEKLDTELTDIISGRSDKFMVIIGPCSADNADAVYEYISRLKRVQEKVADRLVLVPRIYTNKPRTTGMGYKGMLHQPDPEKAPDLLHGIIAIRKVHMHALKTFEMPIADEMLYPENFRYLSDVLSYVAVGARSVEDQQHRLVASGIDVATGMKNPTSGDFSVMLNSITAAQHGHNFIYRGWDTTTSGNPYAHAILRGAVNKHGQSQPNYHYEDLKLLYNMYMEKNLKNPACIVDCNHSNSNKQYMEQIRITQEVMHSRKHSREIHDLIKGLMIESYLVEGNQPVGAEHHVYGKSITDPCLGWEDSERLIYEIAEKA